MKSINIHGVDMPVSYKNEDGLELRLVIYPCPKTNRLKVSYVHGKPINGELLTFQNDFFPPENSLKKELQACKNALIKKGYVRI